MKFVLCLLHNSTKAFCLGAKALSNDFSKELIYQSNILVT